ncbi:MAG: hypothetical protein WAO52_01270, partial [Prolixibacteraceae bacterium]
KYKIIKENENYFQAHGNGVFTYKKYKTPSMKTSQTFSFSNEKVINRKSEAISRLELNMKKW